LVRLHMRYYARLHLTSLQHVAACESVVIFTANE